MYDSKLSKRINRLKLYIKRQEETIINLKIKLSQSTQFIDDLMKEERTTKQELSKYFKKK